MVDLAPEKVNHDDAPKTEDIFIDDDLFSDSEVKDKGKQYTDNILQQTNHGDMCITQPIVEPMKPEPASTPLPTFNHILLPQSKKSLPKASK